MAYEECAGLIGFRFIGKSLKDGPDCPHWAKGRIWVEMASFTGDPVQDKLINEWELERLRAEAADYDVLDSTQWRYKAETYMMSWNADWARSQFIVSSNEDVAKRWLAKYVTDPKTAWEWFLPYALALYPEGSPHRASGWNPKVSQHTSLSQVTAPNGKLIVAMSTSLKQQGDTGDIYIDEAAISDYDLQKEMFAALSPVASRGFNYTLSSRHNGVGAPFYAEVQKAKSNPRWAHFRTTIFDACVQGARQVNGEIMWPSELAAMCPSEADFRQQYLCEATVGGAGVIDGKALKSLFSRSRAPVAHFAIDDNGKLTQTDHVAHEQWGLRVWELPVPGIEYTVGADFASGRPGPSNMMNRTAFDVTRVDTGSTVAEVCGRMEPEIAARALIEIGKMYNEAFLVPEYKESGMTALGVILGNDQKHVPRYNLARVWKHKTSYATGDMRYGFLTNGHNRPGLMDRLVYWINRIAGENYSEWPNNLTIVQASTLVLDDKAVRPKIVGKGQDDQMLAKALSLAGAEFRRQRKYVAPAKIPGWAQKPDRSTPQAAGVDIHLQALTSSPLEYVGVVDTGNTGLTTPADQMGGIDGGWGMW